MVLGGALVFAAIRRCNSRRERAAELPRLRKSESDASLLIIGGQEDHTRETLVGGDSAVHARGPTPAQILAGMR